jgi:hypothetical protein
LEELRDPNLRPTQPSEPLPEGLDTFVPACPIELDKQIFAEALRSSRRGLSAAVTGNRNEYLKLCLEEDIAFNLLHQAASRLARAQVPESIIAAMKISKLTALLKPNGRVRGISAAEVFRRLTSKTVARQEQSILRDAVSPLNFGLSDRSGTDALAHFLQFLSDMHPGKVIMTIDGVGAFDHVCRTRIFEQLHLIPALHGLIPFVRQWYSTLSVLAWTDAAGQTHHHTTRRRWRAGGCPNARFVLFSFEAGLGSYSSRVARRVLRRRIPR